nr:hypothetical protein [uncultured Desulfuromonas sp.]
MRSFKCLCTVLLLMAFFSSPLWATETRLTVRAKAHDAKFIGTSMGTVDVSIYALPGHQLLASGAISGGTGDTDILLKKPIARNQTISTQNAAAFQTTLDINTPTQVEIVVNGPLVAGQSATKQSKTIWLIPGHHLDGDGIIFEFYGLVVQSQSPFPNQSFKVGEAVSLQAFITMMCGCPVQADSLWPADQFTAEALIRNDSDQQWRIPLTFSGKTGLFSATWRAPAKGAYQVIFSASEDHQNNHGVAFSGFSVK